jgi:hypothetical protein
VEERWRRTSESGSIAAAASSIGHSVAGEILASSSSRQSVWRHTKKIIKNVSYIKKSLIIKISKKIINKNKDKTPIK